MLVDLDNPVVQLCAAGMQVDGEPAVAMRLDEAEQLALRALRALDQLPADDGYQQFVRVGLERLLGRVRARE